MLEKLAKYFNSGRMPVQALNKPAWAEFNLSMMKVASINKSDPETDLNGFDLEAAVEEHPEHLFIKVFAIKKDEVNDNGDAFSEVELKKAAHTFVGVPVFTNHQNDDIEKAKGKVVHAWYDENKGGIWIVARIDKVAYPQIARGIEEGYITGTSMGAQVQYSLCSICHNKAHTADEYCAEPSTPILMGDFTTKRIDQIQVGDEVIDAFGKPTKVTQLFRRPVKEKVLLFKSRAIDGELIITKNHPLLVKCRGEYSYHPAEFSDDGHEMFMPVPQIAESDAIFDAIGMSHLDEDAKADLCRLIGYYAAEGCVVKRHGKAYGVDFSLCADETDLIADIDRVVTKLFGKSPYHFDHRTWKHACNAYVLRTQNPEAIRVLSTACPGQVRKGYNKRFHRDVFALPSRYVVELLRGMVDGDGYADEYGKVQLVSACGGLASQVAYLMLKIGASPSVNHYVNSGGPRNRDKTSTIWRVSLGNGQLGVLADQGRKFTAAAVKETKQSKLTNVFTKDGLFAKHSAYSVEEVDYEGEVFNFETESHSYVANNTAVHNCSHVKNQKNKKVSSRVACAFHDSKSKPEDKKCPICGCEKGETKYHDLKQAQVHEWNYGIKFIEDSLVVNPACHDCTVECILNVPHVETKLSQLRDRLKSAADQATAYQKLKVAAAEGLIKSAEEADFGDLEEKFAGKIELDKLNEAQNLLEIVMRSMLDQKQQVSMEYVKDISDILKTAQEVTDELNEMGYGQLPSSPMINEYLANIASGGGPAATAAAQPQQQPQQQSPQMAPPSGGVSADGIATVTKPTFKGSSGKKEEILTAALKFNNTIESLRSKLAEALAERDVHQTVGVSDHTNKESGVMAQENTKTAAGSGQTEYNQQVTTEKQLAEKANKLHPRTETYPEEITQAQLGGTAKTDVTSESPQVRLDNSPEVITEAQMAAVKGDDIVRWGTFPEVITEKQWEDMHRAVGAVLSEDQADHITQAQLRDLLSHHTWADDHNPDVITERQLETGGFGDGGSAGNLDRLDAKGVLKAASYKYDARKLIDASIEALSDAIVGYSKSPSEVVKAASSINSNPQAAIKASYLMLVNAITPKKAARKEARARAAYFAKVASDSNNFVKPVDALIASMADRCSGLKAEDFVGAVGFAVSQKAVMAQVDAKVREKLAARDEVQSVPTLDKFDALRKAAETLDRSDDGLYQIQAPLTEVGVSLTNKAAFAKAAVKLAMSNSELPAGVGMTPVEVRVHDKAAVPFVSVTLKETSKMTVAERNTIETKKLAAAQKPAAVEKRAAARQQVAQKTAQMGGGMPDPMGGAPGAGSAGGMPPAGGAPAAPAGAPPAGVESMDQDPNAAGDDAGDTSDHEPLPPGSVCPVCTSEDVDIVEGKGKCKACSAEFTYKVNIDVTRWPNTLDKGESDDADGDDNSIGDGASAGGEQGQGFAMPEQGGEDQSIPVAAMTRLNKNIIQKLAAIKTRIEKAAGNKAEMAKIALPVSEGGLGIREYTQKTIVAGNYYLLGNVSPLTGSVNTIKLAGSNARMCLDTGTPYVMETAVSKDDPSRPFIQWKWLPKVAGRECSSCNRVKKAFVAALKTAGTTEEEFDAMDNRSRGELILGLKAAGAFKVVKTASAASNALSEFKLAYAMPASSFPTESCREKLARRFGEDTVALSGPCEGQNLADCVTKVLKKAEVYADMLAIKVASVWALEDASGNCIEDFVREGFKVKEAQTCCEALKTKYAQSHEYFLDKLADLFGGDEGGDMPEHGTDLPPNGGDDVDPFSDGGDGGEPTDGDGDFGGGDAAAGLDAGADAGADVGGDPAADVQAVDVAPAAGDVTATPGAAGAAGGPTVKLELPLETVLDAVKDSHMNPANAPAGTQLDVEVPAQPVDDAADQALGGGEADDEAMPTDDADGDVTVEDDAGAGDFGDTNDTNNDPVSEDTSFGGESKPEGDAVEKEKAAFASAMKPSTIGRTGKIRMDLSGVLAAVSKAKQKTASEEGKKLDVEQAQDAVPFKYEGGKAIGKEEQFKAEAVDVPSNESKSLMGNEKKVPAEMPKVPTGDQRLGHEEDHLKPELGNKVTGLGGSEGEVVASTRPYKGSTKDIAYTLAARLVAASEKKVDNVKSTSETDGIGKIQDGKVHPHAAAEEPFSAADPEIPEKNKGAFMGHEEESIHDVPKATSEFAPSVPTEKGEKVDEVTGQKAKGSTANSELKSQQYKEAMAVAGRMVAEGHIKPEELMATVSELREYSPKMLKAFANKMFAMKPKLAARKGLTGTSDGTEQPVVINQTDAKKANLSQRIAGLFTLTKEINAVDDKELSDAEFRRNFRR